MAQQLSPWLEGAYGWSFGEGGWNSGMDSNLLKFFFMFDGNVESVVGSLPPVVNGQAYFLTTDNRFYFGVNNTWYSSPCPKHFILKIKSSGDFWQFDGTSAVKILNPVELAASVVAIEATLGTLGTAAFVDVDGLATQDELNVVSAQANAYTDTLEEALADSDNLAKGSAIVGYRQSAEATGRTTANKLGEIVSVSDFITLSAAVDKVAVTGGEVVIPAGVVSEISTSMTVPANVSLKFEQGGKLSLAMGVTVTVLGQIDAGYHQIFEFFDDSAHVSTADLAELTGTVLQRKLKLDWFGAKGDAVTGGGSTFGTDNAAAFRRAALFATKASRKLSPNLRTTYVTIEFTPNASYFCVGDNVLGCQDASSPGVYFNYEGNGASIYHKAGDTDALIGMANKLYMPTMKDLSIMPANFEGKRAISLVALSAEL